MGYKHNIILIIIINNNCLLTGKNFQLHKINYNDITCTNNPTSSYVIIVIGLYKKETMKNNI